MTQRIVLDEYATASVELAGPAARRLAAAAGGRLAVVVGAQPGTVFVTATQHVGTLVTPDVEVLVRPKVPLHNLFLLLDVGLPERAWRPEVFAYGTDRDLLPAVASLFARTLQRTLGAGLRRDYRPDRERLVALRGRVDVAAQFRSPGLATPVACAYDEFTVDIAENRYLLAALRRLLRVPGVPPAVRRTLLHELTRFEGVADGEAVDVELLDRLVITRLNRHYEPALRLAQVVLRDLTLLDRAGSTEASAFLVDMNELFQRFVTDRLRRHLRGRLTVDAEPTHHLGERRMVPVQPDLLFLAGRVPAYVGDVKYKLTGTGGRARSGDYYQLLAYTTALRLPEGVLVYCQADGTLPPEEVVVRNVGTTLWTWALPMTGPNAEVEAGLADLARWVAERAQPASRT